MRSILFAIAACIACLASGVAIAAENLLPGESIVDRKRPELDPQGMPLGAFRLYPSVAIGLQSDSNIFAREQNEIDDRITTLRPRVSLESDWSRHALRASVDASFARYADNPDEDYDNVWLNTNATLDLSRSSALQFRAGFASIHEDRSSPDDAGGIEPTPLDRVSARIGFARRSGRSTLRLSGEWFDEDYDDVMAIGRIVNNDDRDRLRSEATVEFGVELKSEAELYGKLGFDVREYDQALDDNGFDRSSSGNSVAVGVRSALSGASFIDVFAGYVEREYDDATLASIDAPWFGGRLVWNPTGLTTVTLDIHRSIEETTLGVASGYRATRFGLAADHELRRNLLLHAGLYLQNNEYEGLTRDDDVNGITIGARYMMNRFISFDLEYQRRERDSNAAANDYATDIVALNIRAYR